MFSDGFCSSSYSLLFSVCLYCSSCSPFHSLFNSVVIVTLLSVLYIILLFSSLYSTQFYSIFSRHSSQALHQSVIPFKADPGKRFQLPFSFNSTKSDPLYWTPNKHTREIQGKCRCFFNGIYQFGLGGAASVCIVYGEYRKVSTFSSLSRSTGLSTKNQAGSTRRGVRVGYRGGWAIVSQI